MTGQRMTEETGSRIMPASVRDKPSAVGNRRRGLPEVRPYVYRAKRADWAIRALVNWQVSDISGNQV